jgi:curved DNA-binding protein CbpA
VVKAHLTFSESFDALTKLGDRTKEAKSAYTALGTDLPSTKQVNSAYKVLALQIHPDKPQGNEALFKKLGAAKDVLLDTSKRATYEQTLKNNPKKITKLFEELGGGNGGKYTPKSAAQKAAKAATAKAVKTGLSKGMIAASVVGVGVAIYLGAKWLGKDKEDVPSKAADAADKVVGAHTQKLTMTGASRAQSSEMST